MSDEATPPKNFRWAQPGVALSGVPELPDHILWLRTQGVRTICSLAPPPAAVLQAIHSSDIDLLYHPTDHLASLNAGELNRMIEELNAAAEQEGALLIHCGSGGARASTAYAVWRIAGGEELQDLLPRLPALDREDLHMFLLGFAAGRRALDVLSEVSVQPGGQKTP